MQRCALWLVCRIWRQLHRFSNKVTYDEECREMLKTFIKIFAANLEKQFIDIQQVENSCWDYRTPPTTGAEVSTQKNYDYI
jgi:hypothetical protein